MHHMHISLPFFGVACRYVQGLQGRAFSEHDLMDPQNRFYFRDKAIASQSGISLLLTDSFRP